jgi:predicted choloylglycine hydrolase
MDQRLPATSRIKLTFNAIDETGPGRRWAELFQRLWPAYRQWWLSGGDEARPPYLECRNAIREHMPEMLELYDQLVELAGGSDQAARFLSLYSPPPYLSGCSQAVWPGTEPLLVRNYDYSPRAFDAVLLRTHWQGRRVLGMSDCLIGLLDGINDAGLAVSLTFGGRRAVGSGFGIPIVLRYILQTCTTVGEATAVLQRIPCHMAYNVTVLDSARQHKTVFVSPDRPATVTDAAVATNHQHEVEWSEHATATGSVEREAYLLERLLRHPEKEKKFLAAFHRPPLYSLNFDRGFGTLYTAVYRPEARALELTWPGFAWRQSLARFVEGTRQIEYRILAGQNPGAA